MIGSLNEYTLHHQLKTVYTETSDLTEQEQNGYIIDIVKAGGLVEIQTANFSKIRPKLKALLKHHRMTLVHNIPTIKWLYTIDVHGDVITKRKSPKKGNFYHVFDELIYLTDIAIHPGFTLDIVFTEEEELRRNDGRGSWRRKGISIIDRKLVRIIDTTSISTPEGYIRLLPSGLPELFSTKDIAEALKITLYLARKIVYFYKKTGLLLQVAKKGNLLLYRLAPPI